MAEFCPKCWNELNDTDYPESRYILSEALELREGCGEFKKVIVAERKLPSFKRVNYLTAPFKTICLPFKNIRKKNDYNNNSHQKT